MGRIGLVEREFDRQKESESVNGKEEFRYTIVMSVFEHIVLNLSWQQCLFDVNLEIIFLKVDVSFSCP